MAEGQVAMQMGHRMEVLMTKCVTTTIGMATVTTKKPLHSKAGLYNGFGWKAQKWLL